MKKLLIVFGLLFFSVIGCKGQLDSGIKDVSVEEMQSLLKIDDVQLVDVRTPEEFKAGYIANAQNIDYYSPTIDEDILKLDKNKPVIVYCRSGKRSRDCSEKLLEAGFQKIYNLEGGIIQWEHEGKEIIIK
jgi:rhodanese-related sulfurtransferase